MTDDVVIRPAETDADLAAWTRVRRILLPDEPISTLEQLREAEGPDRLLLLAEVDGTLAGQGFAGRSSFADGFAEPRVLPEHRRHGIGSAVLLGVCACRPDEQRSALRLRRRLVNAADQGWWGRHGDDRMVTE